MSETPGREPGHRAGDHTATPDVAVAIADLIYDSGRLLDDERFEDWARLFDDPCIYRITTRENADSGLPISVVFCDSRAMMIDRVLSLRQANIYNPHYARHLITNVRVLGESGGAYDVHSSYMVTQTTLEGETRIFSVGKYLDRIARTAGGLRFRERIVVADTGSIHNLLAAPL